MLGRRSPSGSMSGATQDPLGRSSARRASPAEGLPWTYFLIFLAGTALVVAAMWYHIESQRRSIRAHWEAQVSAIANDRARSVGNWLGARRADAEVLAASPTVRALLASRGRGDEALVQHLNRVVAAYGYASVSIFDAQGRAVARSSGGSDPGLDHGDVALEVARTKRFKIELTEGKGDIRLLTVSVPALAGPASASPTVLGVVTLRMRPETRLFPLLTDETS